MRLKLRLFLITILLLPLISRAEDPVNISEAWARATAPGQEVGAIYMVLQSAGDATLTEVTSPSASSVEIHQMSMNHGVMEMRMMNTLPLPAGQAVRLDPSGLHLMLFDLKKPLVAGEKVTLILRIKDKSGKSRTQKVRIPVKKTED